jgi:hypothetical protein
MHKHHSSEDNFSIQEDDRDTEGQVLKFLLEEHPAQVTEAEVALALIGVSPVFAEGDAIQRALRELVGGGLAYRHGEFFLPTRAARYSASLGEAE